MSSSASGTPSHIQPPATIYPPITHYLSPTWFAWIKLTLYEIHNVLKPAPANFASISYASNAADRPPALFHYINHPIQYVSVVGVVVEINEFHPKYFTFIVDDGSGATIEVVFPRPAPSSVSNVINGAVALTPVGPPQQSSTSKVSKEEVELHQLLATIDVGMVLKIKGHISTFRGSRQIRLDRIHRVVTTNEEAAFWSSMREFHDAVLTKPWILGTEKISQAKLHAQSSAKERDARAARRRDRARLRADSEAKGHRKLERKWEKEERFREEEAQKVKREGESLIQLIRERRLKESEEKGDAAEGAEDIETAVVPEAPGKHIQKEDGGRRKMSRTDEY